MEPKTKTSMRQWFRFIAAFKYGLLFILILLCVPFSVFAWHPQHDLLGGLFTSLDYFDIFWATLGTFLFSWSIMFTEGFLIDDLTGRTIDGEPHIPSNVQSFINQTVTARQLWCFCAFCAPTIVVICVLGQGHPALRILAAVLGLIAAFIVLLVTCTPVRIASGGSGALPIRIGWIDNAWNWCRRFTVLKQFCRFCVDLSWGPTRWLSEKPWGRWFFTSGFTNENGKMVAISNPLAHYFAFTVCAGILTLGIVVGVFFGPGSPRPKPPALAYVYCVLILSAWVFAFFRIHTRRLDLSPLWVMLPIMVFSYILLRTDHFFDATVVRNSDRSALRLTPVEAASSARDNLVIVTSTGGGILAAGWTTLILHELTTNRPTIVNEIKLISGVSGGAVGAAFFADSLVRLRNKTNVSLKTASAFEGATRSSLNELTYGLAMVDFPRFITGGWLPPTLGAKSSREIDRGNWLEFAWRRNAGGANYTGLNLLPSFYDYNEFVKAGIAPSLIFSSTVMESGERVMFCNNRFDDSWDSEATYNRARTFEEYCLGEEAGADISLWTAARMSATFPWVSPAARPNFGGDIAAEFSGQGRQLPYHHFIDGGYYDNYGVSSAMDWLNPVLHDRLRTNSTLTFKKVVIIQLRAYKKSSYVDPENGWRSAMLGPAIGFWAVYDSAPLVRNEIALGRFVENWNSRLGAKAQISTHVVQRRSSSGALSWYLSPDDISGLEADARNESVKDEIRNIIQDLQRE
jgi:hypothetical protein